MVNGKQSKSHHPLVIIKEKNKNKNRMASHKCIIVTDHKDQGTDFEMPIAITYSIKEKKKSRGSYCKEKMHRLRTLTSHSPD